MNETGQVGLPGENINKSLIRDINTLSPWCSEQYSDQSCVFDLAVLDQNNFFTFTIIFESIFSCHEQPGCEISGSSKSTPIRYGQISLRKAGISLISTKLEHKRLSSLA